MNERLCLEQTVSVLRSNTTRCFLLHPLGTFTGYGAYVGINPYRELPADADAEAIGEEVLALLDRSVRTGYSLQDFAQYKRATSDAESKRIQKRYFAKIRGTSDMARKFQQLEVSKSRRSKTLKLTLFQYSSEERTLFGAQTARVRGAGGAVLGAGILQLLP